MQNTDPPIIVEQSYATTLEKLWNALTELNEMKQWYFSNIEAFEAKPGFETQFTVHSEERRFTHDWKVTEAIPFQKIAYRWKYLEYPGDSLASFELSEEETVVKLTLTIDVLESFPSDIPEFKRESCIQGWEYFLGKNLRGYLS